MKFALCIVLLAFAGFARAATVEVVVGQGNTLTFTPSSVTINEGDTVSWRWAADNTRSHNVGQVSSATTCDETPAGAFASSIQTQGTFTQTFPKAGEFFYICQVGSHCASGMKGTIIVKAAAASSSAAPPATTSAAAVTTSAAPPTTSAAAATTTKTAEKCTDSYGYAVECPSSAAGSTTSKAPATSTAAAVSTTSSKPASAGMDKASLGMAALGAAAAVLAVM